MIFDDAAKRFRPPIFVKPWLVIQGGKLTFLNLVCSFSDFCGLTTITRVYSCCFSSLLGLSMIAINLATSCIIFRYFFFTQRHHCLCYRPACSGVPDSVRCCLRMRWCRDMSEVGSGRVSGSHNRLKKRIEA